MNGLFRFTACFVLAFAASLTGCKQSVSTPLSANSIVGVYTGHYDNGDTEVLTVSPDGTFVQVLTNHGNTIYSNKGNWEIDLVDKDINPIILHNVILGLDVWNDNDGKPKHQDVFRAAWDPSGPGIVFADVQDYWVRKDVK